MRRSGQTWDANAIHARRTMASNVQSEERVGACARACPSLWHRPARAFNSHSCKCPRAGAWGSDLAGNPPRGVHPTILHMSVEPDLARILRLREKIKNFPTCPGVYLMKDAEARVL